MLPHASSAGLTVSSMHTPEGGPAIVDALSIDPPVRWPLLVVMPEASLSTQQGACPAAGDLLRGQTLIANVQAVAMLTAAFAQGRGDLLGRAMHDRMHQPYRFTGLPAAAADCCRLQDGTAFWASRSRAPVRPFC